MYRSLLTHQPSFSRAPVSRASWVVYALLVLALLVQSLLPRGYMPTASAGKLFNIEICTAYGAQNLVKLMPEGAGQDAPADPQSTDHTGNAKDKAPCAYAALPLPFLVAVAALWLGGEESGLPVAAFLSSPTLLTFTKHWFAQGPPLS